MKLLGTKWLNKASLPKFVEVSHKPPSRWLRRQFKNAGPAYRKMLEVCFFRRVPLRWLHWVLPYPEQGFTRLQNCRGLWRPSLDRELTPESMSVPLLSLNDRNLSLLLGLPLSHRQVCKRLSRVLKGEYKVLKFYFKVSTRHLHTSGWLCIKMTNMLLECEHQFKAHNSQFFLK